MFLVPNRNIHKKERGEERARLADREKERKRQAERKRDKARE